MFPTYFFVATPYRATDWAPPAALSLMMTLATCGMVETEAVNVMLIVQDVPAASEEPQVLVCANSLPFIPVTAMLLMLNVPGPRLLKVVFTAGLVLPTV